LVAGGLGTMVKHSRVGITVLLTIALHTLTQNDMCEALNVHRASSRRQAFRDMLAITTGTTAAATLTSSPPSAMAKEAEEDLMSVYFGCGCFWHVQHEFVQAERRILKREDMSLTARAGYAGGKATDSTVCYHNALNIGDYGSLGHAEVVALRIPPSSFEEFATEYFKLFDDKGNRPDQFGDRGSEYRNLIGLPGGVKSPYAKQLVSASMAVGDKLDFAVGKGNDKDLRAVAFVMDTETYPFYVAEQYHQFHDGFNLNENYPNSYNSLASKMANSGSLQKSVCPNGALGIGVGGL